MKGKQFPMKEKPIPFKKPMGMKSGGGSKGLEEDKFLESLLGGEMKDEAGFKETLAGLGEEDRELLKLLTSSVPGAQK